MQQEPAEKKTGLLCRPEKIRLTEKVVTACLILGILVFNTSVVSLFYNYVSISSEVMVDSSVTSEKNAFSTIIMKNICCFYIQEPEALYSLVKHKGGKEVL